MTVLYEPVMQLIRASMIPVEPKLTPRSELPACQVVLRVAKSTEAESGVHPIHDLAVGAGVAASGMTFWLAQERGINVEQVLSRLPGSEHESGEAVAGLLRTFLTGPTGMGASVDWLMELFFRDQDAYLDLIVAVGGYIAGCVEILEGLKVSSVEESLEALEDMLREFWDAPDPGVSDGPLPAGI